VLKLTNPDYFLPIVEALEANKILSSGRTRPMIVRGVCRQTGIKGEYVVKLKGSDQMWEGSSLNEILASFIALELNFQVPEPVVINISEEFLETMKNRHDNFMIATKSLGFNFGSALKDGFQEVLPNQTLNAELKAKLCEMFALDVLLGNTDRRKGKPNFLTNGKDLLIFDHELAFSFTQVLSFARNPNPWLISQNDMEWLSNNFCYHYLKGINVDFSNFAARLSVINDVFWEKAIDTIPQEWQNDHINTIRIHVTKIVENREQFALELNRVLL